MHQKFASRMEVMPKSFIREILKISQDPEVISFAGGLPNPLLFPIEKIKKASERVLTDDGGEVLQYSTTEGYYPLREYIAARYYSRFAMLVSPDDILITNGSQQALDLIGKIFLDKGDDIIIEKPGYLGAIQAFSAYEPKFNNVNLLEDGIDGVDLERLLLEIEPKFVYTVPNFQNPSGTTYSFSKRVETARLISKYNTILIEDDPYGELRFIGDELPLIKQFAMDNTILLGSFSKIVAPGMRLGWVVANKEIMEKLIVAKQGADLHSNYFSQRVIYSFLMDYDLDLHIAKIKEEYKKQRDAMVNAMEKYFPQSVEFTRPEGGMFVWAKLPEGITAMKVFEEASRVKVAFVPGNPFYIGAGDVNTMRLNYTNCNETTIEDGIKRLAGAIRRVIDASLAKEYVFEEFIEDRSLIINSVAKKDL